MIIRGMIAEDIPQLAQLYKQFWDEESSLENMIVDNRYRNKGVGKALITELEKKAFEHNCSQIILVTETDRIDACKFYESAGYNPNSYKGFKKKLK